MGGDEGSYQRHLNSVLNGENSRCLAILGREHILTQSTFVPDWDVPQ